MPIGVEKENAPSSSEAWCSCPLRLSMENPRRADSGIIFSALLGLSGPPVADDTDMDLMNKHITAVRFVHYYNCRYIVLF